MRNRGLSTRRVNDTALSRGRPERFRSALQIRADVGITIATGISQWNDQTVNARNFTQGTGANQPLFVASATPAGRPAARFDGTNDEMSTAGFTLNQPFTVMLVHKPVAYGAAGVHDFVFAGIVGNTALLQDTSSGNRAYMFANSASADASSLTVAYHYWSMRFNTTASSFRKDGGDISASFDAGAANAGGFCIGSQGGARWTNQEIAEFVVYSRVLSDFEVARHENYFKAWHGLS